MACKNLTTFFKMTLNIEEIEIVIEFKFSENNQENKMK